ncbi:hypothetical protein GCM10009641_53240 [Mycobacterium cookii]
MCAPVGIEALSPVRISPLSTRSPSPAPLSARPLFHTIAVIEPDVAQVDGGALRPGTAGIRFTPGDLRHRGYAGPRHADRQLPTPLTGRVLDSTDRLRDPEIEIVGPLMPWSARWHPRTAIDFFKSLSLPSAR